MQIGLGSGSRTRVLAGYQDLDQLTVVEINPRYIDAVKQYPGFGEVLTDPRVKVIIDDARRWLNRNATARFDVICVNLWHWRCYSTHLCSREFMELASRHLLPDGVLYLNTTDSEAIYNTAAQVFNHVVRVRNFVAASNSPFTLTPEERGQNVFKFDGVGAPYFTHSKAAEELYRQLISTELNDLRPTLLERRDLGVVTDINMIVEFPAPAIRKRFRHDPESTAQESIAPLGQFIEFMRLCLDVFYAPIPDSYKQALSRKLVGVNNAIA